MIIITIIVMIITIIIITIIIITIIIIIILIIINIFNKPLPTNCSEFDIWTVTWKHSKMASVTEVIPAVELFALNYIFPKITFKCHDIHDIRASFMREYRLRTESNSIIFRHFSAKTQ